MRKSFQLLFFKQTIDQNTLRIIYGKNKQYIIPAVVVGIALFLFIFAVIPQIQNFFALRTETENATRRLAILKENIAFLSRVDTTDLTNNTQTVVAALPNQKDFAGILRAIAVAATDSGVSLGDFSFSVGSLSPGTTKVTNVLPIEIDLSITSDLLGTKRFLETLTKRFPLSEVTTVQVSDKLSTMNVIFYYKPLPQYSFSEEEKIENISPQEKALLDKLSAFQSGAN